MALTIDLGAQNLSQQIQALKPVAGFCLMVDIVGSTEIKDRAFPEWVGLVANTFNHVRAWTEAQYLKTVGDMLMFWFPDAQFHQTTSPLTLFQGLVHMNRSKESYHLSVKSALVRCEEAYEISFMRPGPDVYGKDIDLTARLLALAGEKEVLMNDRFFSIAQRLFDGSGNQEDFTAFKATEGPWTMKLKGVSSPVKVYKWRA